jgi:TMEM175 potassium channel family protein
MRTGRLEAFSDGVIAIIITIMVLEMKVPRGDSPNDLLPVLRSARKPASSCNSRSAS